MENKAVLEIFKECGSLLEGHFLLTSGKHSDRYCQCALLLQHPDKAAVVVKEIADQVKDLAPTVVVGPAMGGVVVAYELARQLGVNGIFTERENGEMTLRRGFHLSPEDRVLISEDVITTGKSTLETVAVIEAAGAKVIGLTALVDRRTPDIQLPFPVYAATTLSVQTFEADACPICEKGTPIVKPGSRKLPMPK
ncbi:orotate phosphoribosyltransferase [Oscillospiraceae bacterium MB08-C2-2]|nr:orotate phosphoribosyltransferase [Oscillospiraceae bacterium MB08-C2-2]